MGEIKVTMTIKLGYELSKSENACVDCLLARLAACLLAVGQCFALFVWNTNHDDITSATVLSIYIFFHHCTFMNMSLSAYRVFFVLFCGFVLE